MSERRH